jgi:hypothetical protein
MRNSLRGNPRRMTWPGDDADGFVHRRTVCRRETTSLLGRFGEIRRQTGLELCRSKGWWSWECVKGGHAALSRAPVPSDNKSLTTNLSGIALKAMRRLRCPVIVVGAYSLWIVLAGKCIFGLVFRCSRTGSSRHRDNRFLCCLQLKLCRPKTNL